MSDKTSLRENFERRLRYQKMSRTSRLLREPTAFFRYLLLWNARKSGAVKTVRANLFWGDEMTVAIPEVVSAELYFNHYAEEPVTYAMLGIIRPGMTVLDIGAHFGSYSLLASRLVSEGGVVHSFEPTPSTFAILEKNVRGRPNIFAHNAAVYSENTTLKFRDYGLARSAFNTLFSARVDEEWTAENEINVKAVAMDSFVEERSLKPDFVKIDAESAEYYVLTGMDRILRENKPVITLEVGDEGGEHEYSSRDLVDKLTSYGYPCYEYAGGGVFRPHTPKETYTYNNLLFTYDIPAILLGKR